MATTRGFSLSVGTLFRTAFQTWFRNLVPFTLLGAAVFAPWIVLRILVVPDPSNIAPTLLLGLLQSVLGNVLTGAVTYGVVEHLRGKAASFGDVLQFGLRVFLRVLLTGVVCGVIVGVGTILLIIPGLIATAILYAAVPAAAIEGLGVGAAMRRSAGLTDGSRWPIFWAALLMAIVFIGVGALVGAILGLSTGFEGEPSAAVDITIALVVSPFFATAPAVCYALLRQGKENVDPTQLAAVFD